MIRFLLLLMLLGTTSCAVYMPMQGAAPDIRDQHQVEVRASTFLSRWEASAAYSPLRHVLVRGAFGRRSDSDDSIYWRGHQYEVAAGTYWPLGKQWLVGGLGGYGQVRSQVRYRDDGGLILLGPAEQHQFSMRANKVFGEAYVIHQASDVVSFGATYRTTRLYFDELTDVGVPVDLRRLTRAEPMVFMRVSLGGSATGTDRPIQLQFSVGTSVSAGYSERQPDPDESRRQVRRGRTYVAVGVGILPHRLAKLKLRR